MKEKPTPLFWFFDKDCVRGDRWRDDISDLGRDSDVDLLIVSGHDGVQFEYPDVYHDLLAAVVSHAHSLGIGIALHLNPSPGFFNANTFGGPVPEVDQSEIFHISDPAAASAIVSDYETVLDRDGKASITHSAKWARPKLAPLYCRILRAYAFMKDSDGFYRPGTLIDVTSRVKVVDNRTKSLTAEADCGRECAGMTLFIMVAQYYNYTQVFGNSQSEIFCRVMDGYADIPLDGIALDEFGYLYLDCRGDQPPFRGRLYSPGMKKYFAERLDTDIDRLLFDMRYAPSDDDSVRIRAINTYFRELRKPPAENERLVYEHAKKLFGDDIYFGTHATFHNELDNDEIWHTGCCWWDIPTTCGHTDENIGMPVRMGVMLSRGKPFLLDMFYSKDASAHYRHIAEGAPFGCFELHHALNDHLWGQDFTESDFLVKMRRFDRAVSVVRDFVDDYPRLDLAVIFGSSAQMNWYPDEGARNHWDINGGLWIRQICDEIWSAGYRCALIPDYTISDGRMTFENGRLCFGGYRFEKVLFLYPEYADRCVCGFLERARLGGVSVAAVGTADRYFDGGKMFFDIPREDSFDISLLDRLGCVRSGISDGCVLRDGSFSMVTAGGISDGEETAFDFMSGGRRFSGVCTGVLTYRDSQGAFGTIGGKVLVDGVEAPFKIISE